MPIDRRSEVQVAQAEEIEGVFGDAIGGVDDFWFCFGPAPSKLGNRFIFCLERCEEVGLDFRLHQLRQLFITGQARLFRPATTFGQNCDLLRHTHADLIDTEALELFNF